MTELASLRVSRITWPVLVEQLLFMLMGTADTFMLSHISGAAVAAVGAANQVVTMLMLIFSMISGGAAVLVAQYLGANRKDECAQLTAASISITLVIGIICSILLVIFRNGIARTMQLPGDVVTLTDAYLTIVGSTIFFQALLSTVGSIIRSYGHTRISMYVSVGMNLIHIVGNYLFIFGALGVPKLGVTGVAISTAVSRLLALIAMVIIMGRLLPYRIPMKDYLVLQRNHVKSILKIGVPSSGEPLAYQIGQVVMTSFMGVFGATVLATRVYTLNLMFYILVFGSAVGFGTQIIVGHLCGAHKFDEAYKTVWKSLRTSLVVTIVIAVSMAFGGHIVFRLFTSDESVIRMGTTLLFICILLEPGRTFNLVIIQSLRAAGDVRFPVAMGIVFPICMGIPLCYWLSIHLHMGLAGMWWTICIDECTRAIIMTFRWKSRVWEKKVLVKPIDVPVMAVEG